MVREEGEGRRAREEGGKGKEEERVRRVGEEMSKSMKRGKKGEGERGRKRSN